MLNNSVDKILKRYSCKGIDYKIIDNLNKNIKEEILKLNEIMNKSLIDSKNIFVNFL